MSSIKIGNANKIAQTIYPVSLDKTYFALCQLKSKKASSNPYPPIRIEKIGIRALFITQKSSKKSIWRKFCPREGNLC